MWRNWNPCGGNVKWYSCYGKQYRREVPKKIKTTIFRSNLTSRYISKRTENTISKKKKLFRLCCVAWGIFVPQSGVRPGPPAVEVQSLNHWTARDFLQRNILHHVHWSIIHNSQDMEASIQQSMDEENVWTYNGVLFSLKKAILPYAIIWMNLRTSC